MFRFLLAGALVAGVATVVVAQGDPIAQRKQIMKNVGAATKLGGELAKGEKPFDLGEAQKILKTYEDAAATVPGLYPETSKTGGETSASPKIWADPAGFKTEFEKWAGDLKKTSGDVKDLATFRASFGAATKACRGCHETYRIKT